MSAYEVEVPGGPQAPAQARRALAERLAGRVPDPVIEDVGLLVSELVTNAVVHGSTGPDARVALRVVPAGAGVRVEVSDPGPGFAPGDPLPDPDGPAGYGLFLVTQLADAWGVAGEGPTRVWFELR